MNAYKQPDVGKSRSIFTPGATAAGRCCCRCCFISEDSLPHPGLSLYLSLGPPSLEECALPVSDLASSYLSFLPSVPIFVVSFGPTFIARCGICDSSGTDCSSDVFVPDPTFVLSSLLPSSLLPLHSLFSFFLSPFPPTRPSLTLSSPSLSVHFLYWLSAMLPSPRILQPCTGPDNSFSSFDHRLSYHRLFAPTAPRMKARIYSYPMSSRIAWHFCQISPRPVN